MSGAIPLLPLYDFMVWTGQALLFYINPECFEEGGKQRNTKGRNKETRKRSIKRKQRKKEINWGKSEGKGVESEERREMEKKRSFKKQECKHEKECREK